MARPRPAPCIAEQLVLILAASQMWPKPCCAMRNRQGGAGHSSAVLCRGRVPRHSGAPAPGCFAWAAQLRGDVRQLRGPPIGCICGPLPDNPRLWPMSRHEIDCRNNVMQTRVWLERCGNGRPGNIIIRSANGPRACQILSTCLSVTGIASSQGHSGLTLSIAVMITTTFPAYEHKRFHSLSENLLGTTP